MQSTSKTPIPKHQCRFGSILICYYGSCLDFFGWPLNLIPWLWKNWLHPLLQFIEEMQCQVQNLLATIVFQGTQECRSTPVEYHCSKLNHKTGYIVRYLKSF